MTPQPACAKPDTPLQDEQLDKLRPTLAVVNGTSDVPAGARTYEFQVSDGDSFSLSGSTITSGPASAGRAVRQASSHRIGARV